MLLFCIKIKVCVICKANTNNPHCHDGFVPSLVMLYLYYLSFQIEPFVIFTDVNGTISYSGFCFNILNELANRFHFKYVPYMNDNVHCHYI